MPRTTSTGHLALIGGLIAALAVQGWMLHRASSAHIPSRNDAMPSSDAGGAGIPGRSADSADIVAHLDRIDARLSAIEQRQALSASTAEKPASLPARLDPATFADADRRLMRLLPDRDLDHQGWLDAQAAIAAQPPDQQAGLSAALARAVNEGRVRLHL